MPGRRSKFQDNNPTVEIAYPDRTYVFDEQTGEIYDWPEGESRKMNRLLELAFHAQEQAEYWADALGAWKALLARQMERAEVDRVNGGPGGASIQEGLNEGLRTGVELAQWCRDVEFPPAQYLSLITCVQAYGVNVAAFRHLIDELGIDQDKGEAMIQSRPYTWVKLTPAKQDVKVSRSQPR